MEAIRFNVKDKSANTFFREHSPEYKEQRGDFGPEMSPYYLMKDEIILKKTAPVKENDTVVFELTDFANGSRKELTSKYTYIVQAYDDVSVKLVLNDFKVTLK